MNPYGVLLRFFRELRGLSQGELAAQLGVTNRLLSAVETGRRSPHDQPTLERIRSVLSLSDDEYRQLHSAAEHSSMIVRIPSGSSPERIALVHRLVAALGELQHDQIMLIRNILQGRQTEMF